MTPLPVFSNLSALRTSTLSYIHAQKRETHFLFRYSPTRFLYNKTKHSNLLPCVFATQKHPVILRDTAGRRVNNPLFIAEKCTYIALRHPVMPRDTAAEECEILVDGIGIELIKSYKNEREAKNLLPFRVIELGFEPKTHSLEGCCSIQLS